jgi:hypothetical protein
MRRKNASAVLGFSCHTGWAAMLAASGPPGALEILERRRIEMIAGHDPGQPPFVYHAARALPLPAAERLVREAAAEAEARAREALAAALDALDGYAIAVAGFVTGAAPRATTLAAILGSHAEIHAAEGALYRDAIARACTAHGIRVVAVPARELAARAARVLGVAPAGVLERLAEIGRAAGRPWAKDQKDSLLAALVSAGP